MDSAFEFWFAATPALELLDASMGCSPRVGVRGRTGTRNGNGRRTAHDPYSYGRQENTNLRFM